MKWLAVIAFLSPFGLLCAEDLEYRHIGDFVIQKRLKISGMKATPIAIKPLRLSVFTDGISVRISSTGDVDKASHYRIYRSDGIGRQTSEAGALEVVPGVQAVSEAGGVLRQLRLTEDSLTITQFPGVSNQITVTSAVVAPPPRAKPTSPSSPDESTATTHSDR